jgi:hypothetical protein
MNRSRLQGKVTAPAGDIGAKVDRVLQNRRRSTQLIGKPQGQQTSQLDKPLLISYLSDNLLQFSNARSCKISRARCIVGRARCIKGRARCIVSGWKPA